MGIYPDCDRYVPFGSLLLPTETGIVKTIPNRPVHTQLQLENNTHVEYVVPSMELLPGTKIELGSTLDIQIAPVYQFCNTQGPGNTSVK